MLKLELRNGEKTGDKKLDMKMRALKLT